MESKPVDSSTPQNSESQSEEVKIEPSQDANPDPKVNQVGSKYGVLL